ALLAAKKIAPSLKVSDQGQWIYVLAHAEGFAAPAAPDAVVHCLSPASDLYLFAAGQDVRLPSVKLFGGFRGVPRLPLAPVRVHDADLALSGTAQAQPLTVNPLVTQIVNNTSQANWFQYVK